MKIKNNEEYQALLAECQELEVLGRNTVNMRKMLAEYKQLEELELVDVGPNCKNIGKAWAKYNTVFSASRFVFLVKVDVLCVGVEQYERIWALV